VHKDLFANILLSKKENFRRQLKKFLPVFAGGTKISISGKY